MHLKQITFKTDRRLQRCTPSPKPTGLIHRCAICYNSFIINKLLERWTSIAHRNRHLRCAQLWASRLRQELACPQDCWCIRQPAVVRRRSRPASSGCSDLLHRATRPSNDHGLYKPGLRLGDPRVMGVLGLNISDSYVRTRDCRPTLIDYELLCHRRYCDTQQNQNGYHRTSLSPCCQ